MPLTITEFITRWKGSAGAERANKDSFLRELCEALDLPIPGPKDLSPHYCFEKDLLATNLDGSTTTKFIDLYKEGAFVLEAKQASEAGRRARGYDKALEQAFGQAVNYAVRLKIRPPFVLVVDLGHGFHLWEGFTGSYGGYGARQSFTMDDLLKPELQGLLRTIWLDPQSLDPARRRAKVTREVAKELGQLAASLEGRFPAQAVANFLMRCVFTFFAEDVGLLPEREFQDALDGWRKDPSDFVPGLESMWDAMNRGGRWGKVKLLRFNGGLFAESLALDLSQREIEMLFQAARFDWAEVDPSIFGTLLESALSPLERHRLGAHYTPRAFIERLLRPALEEPLRGDWDLVQAEAKLLLGDEPGEPEKAKARALLHAFHQKLANLTVLDPACGSGNFLYVAYDLVKRLEQEVLSRLQDYGETRQALQLDQVTVTPAHFLGLELKPWAAAIAELVLWIGHLQWWRRLHPTGAPPEPVLQRYENIQNRDAVLTWEGTRDTGETRWDGVTTKAHPVTGLQVPDDTAKVPILEFLNPKPAPWPAADFIVGNPPFLGNARMRDVLGDGYTVALRATYPEVPDTVDFVLYWWHKAAEAVRSGRARRFGLITTNSIRQVRQRVVIAHHCNAKKHPIKLLWAIPDHPWPEDGADVRISMTVGGLEGTASIGRVAGEASGDTPEAVANSIRVENQSVKAIHEDLSCGARVTDVQTLRSNTRVVCEGMKPHGMGFIVTPEQWRSWGSPEVIFPYRNGRDLTDAPRGVMIIDLHGLTESQVLVQHPAVFQHVSERVKPEREQNNDRSRREKWWLFGRSNGELRAGLAGLNRYIVTVKTAKHRFFQFLEGGVVPDSKLIAFAFNDPFALGVLSSRIHLAWCSAASSALGVGNDPTYVIRTCFDPFPFPDATEAQKVSIRASAERLESHRKTAQGRGATITGMYNLLAKLRSGEAFTAREREQHEAAQTEILRQLHDELDATVAETYGWPVDLPEADVLERLVALNKERAREEAQGVVRWLRPEYQAPQEAQPQVQSLELEIEEAETLAPTVEARPWPKEAREQLAAMRDLILGSEALWSLEAIAACFKSRGRYREGIQGQLEILTDLRVIEALETTHGVRWHRPQAVSA